MKSVKYIRLATVSVTTLLFCLMVATVVGPGHVFARVACDPGYHATADNSCVKNDSTPAPDKSAPCDPTKTTCGSDPAADASEVDCNKNAKCESIFTQYLIPTINLLSAAVGIIAVAMIIYGGIEFSSSGGDPQRVASAKNHITNAIIALVAFLFLWAFLNFIMPGGVLNGV